MRHRKDGFKLGRRTAHRWALFRNLLTELFRHERITTTEAKAKAIRGLADHMITLAKRENLHARRQVLAMVPDAEVVRKMFETVAARYADRNGGYTRIIHAGVRPGDGAPTVLLELVDRPETPAEKDKGKGKGEKKRERGGESATGGKRKKREKAAAAAG
jgi:large subunit ribosomal protein L17